MFSHNMLERKICRVYGRAKGSGCGVEDSVLLLAKVPVRLVVRVGGRASLTIGFRL